MATVEIYQTVPFPSMVAGYSLALVSSRPHHDPGGTGARAVRRGRHRDLRPRGCITTAELPKNLAFVAAPLLLGSAVREHRASRAALVERAETAERTREEEALRRVGEERLRIARDVHDVVAHAMVAINVQAGVGAHLLDRDPEQARRTLQDIKKLSGEALDDLRATLGTLRPPRRTRPRRCSRRRACWSPRRPGSGSARASGRRGSRSTWTSTRPSGDLPAAVTTTGYRIVQEALTNVVRHASGSRAQVRVSREDDRVVVDVQDDGRGVVPVGAAPAPGTGSGVRGMRERALGRRGAPCEAGPVDGGGWRVLATLPIGGRTLPDPRSGSAP